MPHRRKILSRVVLYLRQRKPNARPEWIRGVPRTAQRLEDLLYRKAATYAEYNDMNTLRARLQQIALRLGHKARQAKLQANHGNKTQLAKLQAGRAKAAAAAAVTARAAAAAAARAAAAASPAAALAAAATSTAAAAAAAAAAAPVAAAALAAAAASAAAAAQAAGSPFQRWQSNNNMPHRKAIMSRIVWYLQHRRPNASAKWTRKVPRMAQRLENLLYLNAASFTEYSDAHTLRARLQQAALRLCSEPSPATVCEQP